MISKSLLSSIFELSIEVQFSENIFIEPKFNASRIKGGGSLGPF
jgi:hypothetical protein